MSGVKSQSACASYFGRNDLEETPRLLEKTLLTLHANRDFGARVLERQQVKITEAATNDGRWACNWGGGDPRRPHTCVLHFITMQMAFFSAPSYSSVVRRSDFISPVARNQRTFGGSFLNQTSTNMLSPATHLSCHQRKKLTFDHHLVLGLHEEELAFLVVLVGRRLAARLLLCKQRNTASKRGLDCGGMQQR